LEKQLGREYLAFADDIRNIDLNSKDGEEILSIFDTARRFPPPWSFLSFAQHLTTMSLPAIR
jgi:hypothetical protein